MNYEHKELIRRCQTKEIMNDRGNLEVIITRVFKSPVGEMVLGSYQDKLCLADWKFRKMRSAIDQRIQNGLNAKYESGTSPVIEKAQTQLLEYLDEKRQTFDVPLLLVGTEFQKSVWQALLKIPFGATQSYLELSQNLNNEKAIRAVGSANGANAISIIVPCHRIVGSKGDLVGYAGGLSVKKRLLKLEYSLPVSQLQLF